MRKSVLILVLGIAVASVFASCSSSRNFSARNTGCTMSKGFIGYGSR